MNLHQKYDTIQKNILYNAQVTALWRLYARERERERERERDTQ